MTQFADLLVCPRCGGPLEHLPAGLFCPHCGLVYPIREGIPVMLEEEARPVNAPKDPEAG